MTLTLYGTAKSRACRSLIALEELGLPYEHVPTFQRGVTAEDRATVARLNPNGHVPILDDDGFVVWESMAINLYLAEKYGGALWPRDLRDRARACQWTLWSQTEIDRRDWQATRHSVDPERVAWARDGKVAALRVLDAALVDRGAYLLGADFTFADLNVAATLSQPNEEGRIDWDRLDPRELGLPTLAAWLERCTTRRSWRRVGELA
jgi:glutathione S-transferase